ncbi:hypothetical protein NC652_032778 [Populus alba x Populus x berolinensis]|nr:hypothetical protein NC652_032778 [Populus alba x Populus x berolinensis]
MHQMDADSFLAPLLAIYICSSGRRYTDGRTFRVIAFTALHLGRQATCKIDLAFLVLAGAGISIQLCFAERIWAVRSQKGDGPFQPGRVSVIATISELYSLRKRVVGGVSYSRLQQLQPEGGKSSAGGGN